MKINEESKTIKLPIIKTEHNNNISSTNNAEGLLSKSNSSKYLLSKNDSPEKQKTVKVLFQRNKTNVNVKKYISSSNRIRLVISNKLNEYSRSKSKENKKEKKKENKPDIYYYKIFSQGNDTSTIKKCFEHRINWKSEDKKEEEEDKVSFIWAPLSSQINFQDLGYEPQSNIMVNHFEFHNELSNKINMFTNMMIYCENKNLNVLNFLPLTIIIQYERVGFIRQFNHFSHIFYNIERFISDVGDKKVRNKSKYRNLFYVTSPDDKKIGLRTSIFIPRTHYLGKNLWLLKAMNLNRGLGIKIINSVEDCEKYIRAFYQGNVNKCVKDNQDISQVKDNNKKVYFVLPKIKNIDNIKNNSIEDNNHKNNLGISFRKIDYTKIMKSTGEKKGLYKSNKIILQKYIEKPLLYNGRKFDVRLWVLLTHTNEIYLFREGHLKATSFNYTSESTDLYIHLTNYSVQKYSDNFQKFECGNEISFDELQESLNKYYNLNLDIRQELLPKLKNIIFISMESVKKLINKFHRKNCFEIFGYDFMFDADLNPFLIEVNTNPGLEISSPLIKKLVPRMIDDAFRLTIDAKFNTKYSNDRYDKDGNYISPFHVEGYKDSENIYELIGNIKK